MTAAPEAGAPEAAQSIATDTASIPAQTAIVHPYGDAWRIYHLAGWSPLPLPPGRKSPPPTGWTGYGAPYASYADLYAWEESHADGNIAARMGPGVLGVDADQHDGKRGDDTLRALEAKLGPLPPTWASTSRHGTPSRQLFYRVPEGLHWLSDLNDYGGGVEILRMGHRYSVLPPSIHPHTGEPYGWITPDGQRTDEVPRVADLAELTDEWVTFLSEGGQAEREQKSVAGLDATEADAWITARSGTGECRRIALMTDRAVAELGKPSVTHHDVALSAAWHLAHLAAEGHTGVRSALDRLRLAFVPSVAHRADDREASAEYHRLVRGAVDAAAVVTEGGPDPCAPTAVPVPVADDPATDPEPLLRFESIGDLAARVDAMGPRRYLIRGLWPAGQYGVLSAEAKAQKTWTGGDMAVSVASGQPFLGHFPVDTSGPVVLFAGEGGEGNVLRRLRALAAARGVEATALPIRVCCRSPHLSDDAHVRELRAELATTRPVLAILDPLYLSLGNVNTANLAEMGTVLEKVQHACAEVGAALLVVHHDNRNRDATGAGRMSGAGPAEWGRVLMSIQNLQRRPGDHPGGTVLVAEIAIIGSEVPDTTVRVRRTIWADDPDDLDSPLHVEVEVLTADDELPGTDRPPAERRVLAILDAADEPLTVRVIGDRLAAEGKPLRRPTISRALNALADDDLADCVTDAAGSAGRWTGRGVPGV